MLNLSVIILSLSESLYQLACLTGNRVSTSALSRNTFVEVALRYALSYVSTLSSRPIGPASITILADRDYYSQPDSTLQTLDPQQGQFINFHIPLHEAHKTGLGSSAALVTAFTAAVLTHYLPPKDFSLTTDLGKARLHNLAQAAHCAAQGKVGSGFDVAAAVYGSCLYRRFSPSILEEREELPSNFSRWLKVVVEDSDSTQKWDTQIQTSAVDIPKDLRLVMCDVDCGTQTVGMVKRVLAWRKEKPEEASLLWGAIQKATEDLADEFVRLTRTTPTSEPDYQGLRDIINTIRSLTREMSTKSGVPIEPQVQTELLDACCKVLGVVGGVVPGAGGYDAIALLVVDKPEIIAGLQEVLSNYRATSEESGLAAKIGKVRLLGVRQEMDGIRVEDSKGYNFWHRQRSRTESEFE